MRARFEEKTGPSEVVANLSACPVEYARSTYACIIAWSWVLARRQDAAMRELHGAVLFDVYPVNPYFGLQRSAIRLGCGGIESRLRYPEHPGTLYFTPESELMPYPAVPIKLNHAAPDFRRRIIYKTRGIREPSDSRFARFEKNTVIEKLHSDKRAVVLHFERAAVHDLAADDIATVADDDLPFVAEAPSKGGIRRMDNAIALAANMHDRGGANDKVAMHHAALPMHHLGDG